jgi:phosphoribosyl 1,2-cyclic phosphodiesterase
VSTTITFQSIVSSSSGNCVVLRFGGTTLLVDCGLRTQRECEDLLLRRLARREDDLFGGGSLFAGPSGVDAVLVTHGHGDHIGYPALRSLAKHGVPIYAHRQVARALRQSHGMEAWPHRPALTAFTEAAFAVNDVRVEPMAVPHAPGCATFGFVFRWGGRKAVVCTDFYEYANVVDRFADADLIFVEANHDPELLRIRPNYASRFHMSNPKTGRLLAEARGRSARPPVAVRLGHLSNERNTEELALRAVREAFAAEGIEVDFDLGAAPRYRASEEVRIG